MRYVVVESNDDMTNISGYHRSIIGLYLCTIEAPDLMTAMRRLSRLLVSHFGYIVDHDLLQYNTSSFVLEDDGVKYHFIPDNPL